MAPPAPGVRRTSRGMSILAIIQLCCSVLIFVFGNAALGLSSKYSRMSEDPEILPCCWGGTAIWGGIFLMITSALSIAHSFHISNGCLRYSSFTMSVMSAVLSGIICIMHIVWLLVLYQQIPQYPDYRYLGEGYGTIVKQSKFDTVFALLGCVSVLAAINVAVTIISTGMWCYKYCNCCGGTSPLSEDVQYVIHTDEPSAHVDQELNLEPPNAPFVQMAHHPNSMIPSAPPDPSGYPNDAYDPPPCYSATVEDGHTLAAKN